MEMFLIRKIWPAIKYHVIVTRYITQLQYFVDYDAMNSNFMGNSSESFIRNGHLKVFKVAIKCQRQFYRASEGA